MRWNIFSVWWKGGGDQKMLFALFPDQINSLQKNVLLFIKAQLLWVSGGLDCTQCSRDYTACSSTQHPPHLQTSRPHPLRKTEQPPLYSSRQSDVAVRRDQRTDSSRFCLDHLVLTCVRFCTGLDFGYEACLTNVLWNCWHVWLWLNNQLVLFSQAGLAWPKQLCFITFITEVGRRHRPLSLFSWEMHFWACRL